ncbi:MAG TPA: hydrolase [Clostridiales bacterium]|nr:hydrolase [Clostridiales bacterium]
MEKERLEKQIRFIEEIDKIKNITRQNRVIYDDRKENDAEHSWHLAVMAFLFAEYMEEQNLDVLKVMKMVLIHDIVEIDAGDTFCYDEVGYRDKEEREKQAAERLFNILPEDQSSLLWDLWREFEDMKTKEAQFAACLDRFQPLILNNNTNGHTWNREGVDSKKVLQRNSPLKNTTPKLWEYVLQVVDSAVERGILKP